MLLKILNTIHASVRIRELGVDKKSSSEFGQGSPIDEKIVLSGMKADEDKLKSNAVLSHGSFSQLNKINSKLIEGLKSGIDLKSVTSEISALSKQEKEAAGHRRPKITFVKVSPFSFSGSVGATRIPPYDYDWTWQWTYGSPSVSKAATRANGQMSFSLWSDNGSNESAASAAIAIGIYFRPPTQNGQMFFSASPALDMYWGTWCALSSAHTDGWSGLFVGSYNVGDNSYAGTVIDQRNSLFSDDSWWGGIGLQQSSNSGYPLFAGFPVDSSHWYAMWVWAGGYIYASGWGTITGSASASAISISVPSMSWAYFG